MQQPLTITHRDPDDCLGEVYKVAVQNYYPHAKLVSTTYVNRDFQTEHTTAIFRLKPKVKCPECRGAKRITHCDYYNYRYYIEVCKSCGGRGFTRASQPSS